MMQLVGCLIAARKPIQGLQRNKRPLAVGIQLIAACLLAAYGALAHLNLKLLAA